MGGDVGRLLLVVEGVLVIATMALMACGDETGTLRGLRCGDEICSPSESPDSCPVDCSYDCVPETSRCVGNMLAICQEDGLHELVQSCQPDEYCEEGECLHAGD
ncbi:MAG: hypothetical protein JW797_19390 [Bradymonadales bacterium]|nr:hypothetical protein [Bradymonadales bacterium]